MATVWKNAKTGDTISAEGTTYTVTRNGQAITSDISKWGISAEQWVKRDILSGYYTEFLLTEGGE